MGFFWTAHGWWGWGGGQKGVANKILWRDTNYIVDVAMWQKFGNSSISMEVVIKPQF